MINNGELKRQQARLPTAVGACTRASAAVGPRANAAAALPDEHTQSKTGWGGGRSNVIRRHGGGTTGCREGQADTVVRSVG